MRSGAKTWRRTFTARRFGQTDELAGAIAFLLSPAAAYINGAVLRVDGGYGLSLR